MGLLWKETAWDYLRREGSLRVVCGFLMWKEGEKDGPNSEGWSGLPSARKHGFCNCNQQHAEGKQKRAVEMVSIGDQLRD